MVSRFREILEKGIDAARIRVDSGQAAQLEMHAQLLMLWNEKINLTAIRQPGLIAEKHFIDCILAFQLLPPAQRLIDIGSGGGFPGMVFKVLNPELEVLLIDASRKKVNFLNHVIRSIGLEKINAIHTRIEDLHDDPEMIRQFDLVTSRAFAQLSKFEKLAQPFVDPFGTICALKGKAAGAEISEPLRSAYRIQIKGYQLPFEKSDRKVVLMQPDAAK